MKVLTREEFVERLVLPTRDMEMPELGAEATVRLKTLNGNELGDYFEAIRAEAKDGDAPNGYAAELLVRVIVDEDGERLFKDEDVKLLGERLGGVAFQRLHLAAQRLNGLDLEIEDLVKN